jgi:hypothetical protein
LFSRTGQIGATLRAKRSKYVYLPAESSDSLDYNETPPNVPITSSQLGWEYSYGSSFAEESESNSSETEPDNDEEMAIFSGLVFTKSR